jgi:hypothetical protein
MAEEHLDLVSERVAGASYQQLSLKHGLSYFVCRLICKKAARAGLVTPEQIRWRPRTCRTALPDEAYNRRWIERVTARTTKSATGCWLWQGHITVDWGYGTTCHRDRHSFVHRKMYELVHGVRLTRHQYVCHSCDVRHCCNPDHLWLGSNSDNQKDSGRKFRHYESRRLYCEHGHEFTVENTRIRPTKVGGVARICKECERARGRAQWANGKAKERQKRLRAKYRANRLAEKGDSHV